MQDGSVWLQLVENCLEREAATLNASQQGSTGGTVDTKCGAFNPKALKVPTKTRQRSGRDDTKCRGIRVKAVLAYKKELVKWID